MRSGANEGERPKVHGMADKLGFRHKKAALLSAAF